MTMDTPMCEQCGETQVTVRAQECGLCDDCAQNSVRSALREAGLFENACARIVRSVSITLICLEPFGIEHDHEVLP